MRNNGFQDVLANSSDSGGSFALGPELKQKNLNYVVLLSWSRILKNLRSEHVLCIQNRWQSFAGKGCD